MAVVTLARPPVNALGREIREAMLLRVFDRLEAKAEVRCIVLTANGHVFCAGADLKEKRVHGNDDGDYVRANRLTRDAFFCIVDSSKPVIAAVRTVRRILGAGFVLAACCDMILASDTAVFGMPEIDVGQGGGASVLQRILPPSKVRRMMLTGERVPASELYRLGAVEACLPPADLLPARDGARQHHRGKKPCGHPAHSRLVLPPSRRWTCGRGFHAPSSGLCTSGAQRIACPRTALKRDAPSSRSASRCSVRQPSMAARGADQIPRNPHHHCETWRPHHAETTISVRSRHCAEEPGTHQIREEKPHRLRYDQSTGGSAATHCIATPISSCARAGATSGLDPDIYVGIVTGTGQAFCGGRDVKFLAAHFRDGKRTPHEDPNSPALPLGRRRSAAGRLISRSR